ncbi:MAG: DUF362 domain-containing protein [Candidatus Solibacter usitatus]|nr:DUF362 domain-containing protein [Candidatus Solibacter usitatus]
MTRRELLAALGPAAAAQARSLPSAPVAVARCRSYDEDLPAILGTMFDQIGGLQRLVGGKTVTIKLNLTGSPALRFQGRPLGATHYTHPKTAAAMAHLMDRAGARRIRFVESCWATAGPLEEYLLESGWNVRSLKSAARAVEFVNTNALGGFKRYARFRAPGGGLVFPGYDLNQAYEETDVLVSMAKLKNHATCGVTLAMKNMFGITPASIYGDDAGVEEPNESPAKGRVDTCHLGKRQPARCSPAEIDAGSPRDPGRRMPRIVAELNAARPVGIAFIDGVQTVSGGEGPWTGGLKAVAPGLLILGTNAVCTDAVGTALMGYQPRAGRGTGPFATCDNMLLAAEQLGLGTADLEKIDIRGLKIEEGVYRFS